MSDQVDFGGHRHHIHTNPSGDEESKGPFGLGNLGGDINVEDLTLFGTHIPGATKDSLEKSRFHKNSKGHPEPNQPGLHSFDEEKVTGDNFNKGVEEIRTNPWFKLSFLALYISKINDLLNSQQNLRFKETMNELQVRSTLFELSKTVASIAKALVYNQAQEQVIQAIASFTNAAISTGLFLQTARTSRIAEKNVEKRIEAEKTKLNDLKAQSNNVQAGNSQENLDPALTSQKIKDKEAFIADLEKPERRNVDVDTERRNLDAQNQQLGQALQQTIQGFQSAMIASIKFDSGDKEYLQKLTEGFIQSMNKFSESISKHRDESASDFNRFLEDLKKIIESGFKAHYLGNRG